MTGQIYGAYTSPPPPQRAATLGVGVSEWSDSTPSRAESVYGTEGAAAVVVAGPSGCCAVWIAVPEQAVEASSAAVDKERAVEDEHVPLPALSPLPSSSPTKLKLARVSTATHLSIASSPFVLPFSSRRRPSIPIEDFPTSPTDDEWEDLSFEEDNCPGFSHVSAACRSCPVTRITSEPKKPTQHHEFTFSNDPPKSARFPSVYSTYSFHDPAQLDAAQDDQSDILADLSNPTTLLLSHPAVQDPEVSEFGQVPVGQTSTRTGPQSRLGGFKDKFRWLPGRSGSGQDSSSDESGRLPVNSDTSSIETSDSICPLYARAKTTTGKSVAFSKPGFRSLRKPGSPEFHPEHEYRSSTDSSSYAPLLSSFEWNLRVGGRAGNQSSCDDSFTETSPRSMSPFVTVHPETPKNITGPPVPSHVRSRSHNFQYPRPRTGKSFESLRLPRLRDKNDVPHHPFQPSALPYPLAYSSAMMAADLWNHALLFGDERNPVSAGGLLCGSTVSFSQFYGVASGREEVLKGRELRGGRVLDIGCGEGLWVLTAAKEWNATGLQPHGYVFNP
ncbi:hypothetical protein FRC08_004522 [Ceratobasidium sp. 394]|nr:hypothetical protein FRC08_004522 [Ceratobasidium sp. 394]